MALIAKATVALWLCCYLVAAGSPYESKYDTKLEYRQPDEIVEEPLDKIAFSSCQKIHLNPKPIYDSIVRYNPDLFLYTGDIVYAPNGCCEPKCLEGVYKQLTSSPIFQEFERSVKRIEGIYDDHDFGINDADGAYIYKDFSQKILMDFLKKPEDHYRRKRRGAYFSVLFRDNQNPKKNVKLIVLDTRYHRGCYYYCPCSICHWVASDTTKYIFHRMVNYLFGFGWDHGSDALGEEQWKWLEGQLHDSEAESHIIVSSIQIFTRYPITESWGLLPRAKTRLVDLIMETKPKNPIFISGDVHYGVVDVMDGVVEITASSMTHSVIENGKNKYRLFALSVYLTREKVYMYNNFGGIEYEYDEEKDALKWAVKLFDVKGQLVDSFVSDGSRDPRDAYMDLDKKPRSFFKDHLLVKPRGMVFKIFLVYLVICVVTWMVLVPYIAVRHILKKCSHLIKDKSD